MKPSKPTIHPERFSYSNAEVASLRIITSRKRILYVDMDNVLVDFESGIAQLDEETKLKYDNRLDDVPGIFSLMSPVEGAIEAFTELAHFFDTSSFLPHPGRIQPRQVTSSIG